MPVHSFKAAIVVAIMLSLSACGPGINVRSLADPTATSARQSAIELVVKTHFAAIIRDIDAGGGPELDHLLIVAQVPAKDRPTRILQLHRDADLYRESPGALVAALTLYGA